VHGSGRLLIFGGSRVFVTELEGGTLTSSAGDLVSLLVRLVDPARSRVGEGLERGGVWWAGRRHAVGS
jgi:hypothetical protein